VTVPHPKTISAEEAAALVRSGDWLDYGGNLSQPVLFDRALAARAAELRDVKVRSTLSLHPRAILEADPTGEHFQHYSWHFSAYDRRLHDAGRTHYIPMNFGEAPDYYRRFIDPPDVVCLRACPMDEHGFFNFSASVTYAKALSERAKLLIIETSPRLPHVYGSEEAVHASEVDFVIEGPDEPLTELANPEPNEVDRKVAERIAAEIEDGACLQIGIGGMPNAVCSVLADAGHRDLGIHTEMLVDGMIDLIEGGIVTGARKTLNRFESVFTFALGSKRLYDFIHKNPRTKSHAVDYTNLPHHIMQNERVVAINNTTQIDLQGQAASESDGHRHLTGTGGQLQFMRGAYASRGGKSFLCLSSVYERRGQRRSRIVSALTPPPGPAKRSMMRASSSGRSPCTEWPAPATTTTSASGFLLRSSATSASSTTRESAPRTRRSGTRSRSRSAQKTPRPRSLPLAAALRSRLRRS
jgi:acyl-CoA hydrolase